MLKFFREWKRKTGLATLLLACVFAMLWVRTQFVIDTTDFGGFSAQVSIVSEIDAFAVTIWREDSKPLFRYRTPTLFPTRRSRFQSSNTSSV